MGQGLRAKRSQAARDLYRAQRSSAHHQGRRSLRSAIERNRGAGSKRSRALSRGLGVCLPKSGDVWRHVDWPHSRRNNSEPQTQRPPRSVHSPRRLPLRSRRSALRHRHLLQAVRRKRRHAPMASGIAKRIKDVDCSLGRAGSEANAKIRAMADLNNYLPAIDIAGAVASVVGLSFTIYVLIVAKGVKKQVEEAKALARKRNLVEELNDASQKLEQIGNFLQQRQWVGVQIRTAEVLTICREAMARWSDHLSEERRNGVSTAMTQVQTIATQLAEIGQRELTPRENKGLAAAHLKASGHISDALGEARRQEERDGSNDAN